MEQVTIIGIDLAKRVFQVHGAASDGKVAFRKKVSRAHLLSFLAKAMAMFDHESALLEEEGTVLTGPRSSRLDSRRPHFSWPILRVFKPQTTVCCLLTTAK